MKTTRTKLREAVSLFRSPLSLRIVFGIFVSLVVIEGILLVPSIDKRRQEVLEQLAEVSAGKVDWILNTYPNADGDELLAQLQLLYGNSMLPVIRGGAVYRTNGEQVGNFGESPAMPFAQARRVSRAYQQAPAGDRYDVSWIASQLTGDEYVLILRHDASGTRAAVAMHILRVSLLVLVISAFITLVMMIHLSRSLISPILTLRQDLSKAGEAIAADQPCQEFASHTIQRHDELGDVIAAFQQMYYQICQAIDERKQAETDLRHQNEHMQLYLMQVDRVTTAVSDIENGTFTAESLDEVADRPDELGQLARMFQSMAEHIRQREDALKQQLIELSVEIDPQKRQQQVAQITTSDYFQELQAELDTLRADEFWS